MPRNFIVKINRLRTGITAREKKKRKKEKVKKNVIQKQGNTRKDAEVIKWEGKNSVAKRSEIETET